MSKTNVKKRKGSKLTRRTLLWLFILSLIITIGCCAISCTYYTYVLMHTYHDQANDIADTAHAFINADQVESFYSQFYNAKSDVEAGQVINRMEKTQDYQDAKSQLSILQSNMKANSIYIVDFRDSSGNVNGEPTYLLDAEDPLYGYEPFSLGAKGKMASDTLNEIQNVYTSGKPSEGLFISTNKNGYNTTAVSPIIATSGTIVGVIAVEVAMPNLKEAFLTCLFYTAVYSLAVTVIILFFYWLYHRRKYSKPVNTIITETQNFDINTREPSEKLLKIRTKNEIEDLAKGIHQLEVDVDDYINNLEQEEAVEPEKTVESSASEIQRMILPSTLSYPRREEIDLYAILEPAEETGGDFYDFFKIDEDHLGITVASIKEKGVPAALSMVTAKTLIKDHAKQALENPAEIFETVNQELLEMRSNRPSNITAWFGVYEISSGKLNFASAGNILPLLIKEDSGLENLETNLNAKLATNRNSTFKLSQAQLKPEDKLILYTVKVDELKDNNENTYSQKRFNEVINNKKDASILELLTTLYQDILIFIGDKEIEEDIILAGLKVNHLLKTNSVGASEETQEELKENSDHPTETSEEI